MIKKRLLLVTLGLVFSSHLNAQENPSDPPLSKEVAESSKAVLDISKVNFGVDPSKIFTFYQPNYFIVGKDDLKLQFSSKYRVAGTYNLYLAYTQLMFWHIYEPSMPFEEINYMPEMFYRLTESRTKFLRSIDIGVNHNSNGEDEEASRSINSAFIKGNFIVDLGRINVISELKLFYTFTKDKYSKSTITDHKGYWEYKGTFTHLITHRRAHLDMIIQINAGKKVYNLSKGSREIGLIYDFGSLSFNPNIYLQYFSGYGENLLHQNRKQDALRLGLTLSI